MAIILKDGERLYFTSWEYNAARILTELANIVESHGGRVQPLKTAIISNRSFDQSMRETQEKVNRLQEKVNAGSANEIQKNALAAAEKELEELQRNAVPVVTVTHTSYIKFVLDDHIYYYQTDDNPFFPFYYSKTPVNNGKYSQDACMEEDKKSWCYDCFLGFNVSTADFVEAANLLFNMLMSAKNSIIRRDTKKVRVNNHYDNRYHYEYISSPERIGTVNF